MRTLLFTTAFLLVAAFVAAAPSMHEGTDIGLIQEVDFASIAVSQQNSTGGGHSISKVVDTLSTNTHHRSSTRHAAKPTKPVSAKTDIATLTKRAHKLQAELDAVKLAIQQKHAPTAALRLQELHHEISAPGAVFVKKDALGAVGTSTKHEVITAKLPKRGSDEHREIRALHSVVYPPKNTAIAEKTLRAAVAVHQKATVKLQEINDALKPDRGTWGLTNKGNTKGQQSAIDIHSLNFKQKNLGEQKTESLATIYAAAMKFGGGPQLGRTPDVPVPATVMSAIDPQTTTATTGATTTAPATNTHKSEIIYHNGLPPVGGEVHKTLIAQHNAINTNDKLAIEQKTLNDAINTIKAIDAHTEKLDKFYNENKIVKSGFKAARKPTTACLNGKCDSPATPKPVCANGQCTVNTAKACVGNACTATPTPCLSGQCSGRTEARLLALTRAASRVVISDIPRERRFNLTAYPVIPEYYPVRRDEIISIDDKRVDEIARKIILELLKEQKKNAKSGNYTMKPKVLKPAKLYKPIMTTAEYHTLEQLMIDIEKYLRARDETFTYYYSIDSAYSFKAQPKNCVGAGCENGAKPTVPCVGAGCESAAKPTVPCVGAGCEAKHAPGSPVPCVGSGCTAGQRERRSTRFVRLIRNVAFATMQQNPQDVQTYLESLTVIPAVRESSGSASQPEYDDKYVDAVARKIIAELMKDQAKKGIKGKKVKKSDSPKPYKPIMTEKELQSLNVLMKEADTFLASLPAAPATTASSTGAAAPAPAKPVAPSSTGAAAPTPKLAAKPIAPAKAAKPAKSASFRAAPVAPKAATKPVVAKKSAPGPAAAAANKGRKALKKSNSKKTLKEIIAAAAKVQAHIRSLSTHVQEYYPEDPKHVKRQNLNSIKTNAEVDAIARKIALQVIKDEAKAKAKAKRAAAKAKKNGKNAKKTPKQFMSYKDIRALEKVLTNANTFISDVAREQKANKALGLSFRAQPNTVDGHAHRLMRVIKAVAEVSLSPAILDKDTATIEKLPVVAKSKTPFAGNTAEISDAHVDRIARNIIQELLKRSGKTPKVAKQSTSVPEYKPLMTEKELKHLNSLLGDVNKFLAKNGKTVMPQFRQIPKQKLPIYTKPSLDMTPVQHAQLKEVHAKITPPAKTAIKEQLLRASRVVVKKAHEAHESFADMKQKQGRLFAPKILAETNGSAKKGPREPVIVQSRSKTQFSPEYD